MYSKWRNKRKIEDNNVESDFNLFLHNELMNKLRTKNILKFLLMIVLKFISFYIIML